MIASPSRTEDIRIRALMLDAMEICIRTGQVEKAKEIGQASASLKEKIITKDYRSEDDLLRRISTRQIGG